MVKVVTTGGQEVWLNPRFIRKAEKTNPNYTIFDNENDRYLVTEHVFKQFINGLKAIGFMTHNPDDIEGGQSNAAS